MRALQRTCGRFGYNFTVRQRALPLSPAPCCHPRTHHDRLHHRRIGRLRRRNGAHLRLPCRASIEAALSGLPPEWKQIDVLVNNAGLALNTAPAHEVPLEDWETMIATNCQGLVTMTRAVLPDMVARGSGLVINIGSVAGHYPYPGGNVYGATKAFVEQFTLNLRADLVGTGVRATNIAPGLCGGTEFSNVRFKGDDAAAAKVYEGTQPLTAKDIADTAFWIATLPPHVNVNSIELMPTCQGFSPFAVRRG